MAVIIETEENHNKEVYQTHYYKASYDQVKETYLEIIKELGHHLNSINDDYSEIFSEVPHMVVTAKIVMQNPKETSIDFYISAEYLIASAVKAKKFVETVYKGLEKKYELKGIALHK